MNITCETRFRIDIDIDRGHTDGVYLIARWFEVSIKKWQKGTLCDIEVFEEVSCKAEQFTRRVYKKQIYDGDMPGHIRTLIRSMEYVRGFVAHEALSEILRLSASSLFKMYDPKTYEFWEPHGIDSGNHGWSDDRVVVIKKTYYKDSNEFQLAIAKDKDGHNPFA